jgi:DUF4097 and DUF4098 domain-containing protein YvlB
MWVLLLALFAAQVEERETIQRTIPNATKLLVDNIDGSIHVTGVAGNEVRFTAVKQITADSAEAMAEAKRNVKLDVSTQGSYVRMYVDGPFRQHDRGWQYYGYKVRFDYDIQVPIGAELILKTVNGGEISVKGTEGAFDIRHVNGAITMENLAGAGTVSTVNGAIKVGFAKNPGAATKFHTVNGSIDVRLQAPVNADFHFKTLNGAVYTDFDLSALPLSVGTAEIRNGRFVYRGDKTQAGRAGSGGAELDFETVNGSVRLRSK